MTPGIGRASLLEAPPMRLLDLPPRVAVWRVAWPMAAMGVLRSFYVLTDSFWVGRMGPEPLAALGGSALDRKSVV